MSLFSDKSNSRKGLHFILSSSKKMSHKYMTHPLFSITKDFHIPYFSSRYSSRSSLSLLSEANIPPISFQLNIFDSAGAFISSFSDISTTIFCRILFTQSSILSLSFLAKIAALSYTSGLNVIVAIIIFFYLAIAKAIFGKACILS